MGGTGRGAAPKERGSVVLVAIALLATAYHLSLTHASSPAPSSAAPLASSDALMAHTDTNHTEDSSVADVVRSPAQKLIAVGDGEASTAPPSSVAQPATPPAVPPPTAETRSGPAPTRPTLVQLGSGSTQSSSSATHHPPKKFNASNINKKFMEKNYPAAAIATASSATATSKSTGAMARPQIQTTPSHSRLVAAKLTASPAPSISTAPGWSRPTSTAPSSTGTNSPIGSSPLPSAATAIPTSSAAPQLPHVGKVIQPQPRAAIFQTTNLQKEGSGVKQAKPAWGSVKPLATAPIMTSEDFPTAAEVAKASATRKPKQEELKPPPEPISAVKHRLEEDADTFRGVHLDPNAHHWDEMEEDNDDFLGGVIEFGDGRQYKVEAVEHTAPSPPPASQPEDNSQPVSKEERFVDDFDRSWPKSRTSPASTSRDVPTTSPVLSGRGNSFHGQEHTHPQLFNERSNRLEPYSHSSRPGQSNFQNRRGSQNDGSTSPVDLRGGRDGGLQKNNVQLLQKSGNGDLPPRPRGVNGAPSRGGFSSGSFGGDRHRERRDHPPSPRSMAKDGWAHHDMAPSTSVSGRDREPVDRGRRSDMGPPPLPPHAARRSSQDGGRQLPPHISPNMPPPRRLPSRDGRFQAPPSPQSTRFAPPSPSSSHASTLALSPGVSSSVALPLTAGAGADLNEVTKDLMQSAAARAKQRKQEEEAQREAQRERARKKALELEEKMKVEKEREELEKKEKEEAEARKNEEKAKAEAVAFIESTVSSVEGSELAMSERRLSTSTTSLPKSLPRRPPSLRGEARKPPAEANVATRRPSFSIGTRVAAPDSSPASQADSWRSKAVPLPPLPSTPPAPRQIQPRPAPTITQPSTPESVQAVLPSPTASTLPDHIAAVTKSSVEELEATNSSNISVEGKEKKGQEEKVEGRAEGIVPKGRPTASDFFDDKPLVPSSKSDPSVWRRKANVGEVDEKTRGAKEETSTNSLRTSGSAPSVKETTSPARARTHMEASMLALDDVMSRIKGAMQASGVNSKETRPPSDAEHPQPRQPQTLTTTKPSPLRERWQAPSKSRSEAKLEGLRESICTASDFPYSPASEDIKIQLPRVSHRVDPIPRKLQLAFSKPPWAARFDILTFDPPVEGMKRDFSVNAVLFRQTGGFKGKRIRILLPRSKLGPPGPRMGSAIKYGTGGAFGKPTHADGATTWRRVPSLKSEEKDESRDEAGAAGENVASAQDQDLKPLAKQQEEQPSHTRVRQPKMPVGSSVAFYRDSRIDVVEADPKPLVNFIVTSELDEPAGTSSSVAMEKGALDESGMGVRNNNAPIADGVKGNAESSTFRSPPLANSKSGTKTPDDLATRSISAPSPTHQTTPWARASLSVPIKDAAARAPDPEHLKAVWSQTSDKPDLKPVNSLEGIADDLTSVPFSIQDVKSEDGETPPPALPSTTSRMSLHEVTKAFQKVPSSSSSNSNQSRNPISPPAATTTPVVRSPYTYSPMASSAMRPLPAYEHYSPMMSHSPSPTMMYPHPMTSSPVPSRMPVNGHAAMYQQPMWIQPQSATSAPGTPGNVMRTMMSPYSAPMMPYPANAVYHMGTMPAPPQLPVGTASGRGRGMPMMSPAMTHATATMYAGSPVMMHMQVPHQNHAAYMSLPPTAPAAAGRGQPRTENGQVPISQGHPPANAASQQPHHPYNPSSFIRSPW